MDYELIILHTLVEIVMDEDASEHLKELRIAALNKVLRRLNAYHHLGFIRPGGGTDWMELCIPSGSAECCWCRKISGAVQPYLSQWCEWGDSGCVN